jgi:uncharacterized protein YkwD
MIQLNKLRFFTVLLLMILIIAGCAPQTPEPTLAPTPAPTAEPETIIKAIRSEAVVESTVIQEPDEHGNIEVLVQGYTSNTCVAVDEISAKQKDDVISIQVQTSLTSDSNCIEKRVAFEKTISLNTKNLQARSYIVTSGIVERFEVKDAQAVDETSTQDSTQGGDASSQDESATNEATVPIEPRDCQDLATFLSDVTIPDNTSVDPGESFTKTWKIRNAGTCTWGPGYELVLASGTIDEAVSLADPFPDAAPSEAIEVSVELTAPTSPGSHSGAWKIKRPEGDIVEIQTGTDFDFWATVIVANKTSVVDAGVVCAESNTAFESQLLQLINTARGNDDLPPYELQSQLTSAARVHTEDMACNQFINHTGSDGSSWKSRIAAQGYVASDTAENIYFGYGIMPTMAMSWWMNSEVHRNNILSAKLTQIGIAYALNPQTGASYYTLVFAVP